MSRLERDQAARRQRLAPATWPCNAQLQGAEKALQDHAVKCCRAMQCWVWRCSEVLCGHAVLCSTGRNSTSFEGLCHACLRGAVKRPHLWLEEWVRLFQSIRYNIRSRSPNLWVYGIGRNSLTLQTLPDQVIVTWPMLRVRWAVPAGGLCLASRRMISAAPPLELAVFLVARHFLLSPSDSLGWSWETRRRIHTLVLGWYRPVHCEGFSAASSKKHQHHNRNYLSWEKVQR